MIFLAAFFPKGNNLFMTDTTPQDVAAKDVAKDVAAEINAPIGKPLPR